MQFVSEGRTSEAQECFSVCVAYSVAYLLHPLLLVQICCARKGSTVLFEAMMALMRLPCAVLMTKETSIIVWIIMKHEN